MKRKFVVILVAQTILIFLALVYAFVERGIAKENAIRAAFMEELARLNAEKAVKQARLAEQNSILYNKAMIELRDAQKIKSPH